MSKTKKAATVLDVLMTAKRAPDQPGPTAREVAAELGVSLATTQVKLHDAARSGEIRAVSGYTVSPVTGIRHKTWFYMAAEKED